ncbi:MAG: hypothetical protein NWQ43_05855 [Dolichospermum sp.]|nr:hypothetical protein [Dolichospermum sp.]
MYKPISSEIYLESAKIRFGSYLTFLTKKSACPQLLRERFKSSWLQIPGFPSLE